MMKLMQITLVVAIMLVCIFAQSIELYTDKFDNVDIEGIIKDDKSRRELEDCLFNNQCNNDAFKFFKEVSSQAYVTNCIKCTEKQKQNLVFINDWYTKNDPETWQKFIDMAKKEYPA